MRYIRVEYACDTKVMRYIGVELPDNTFFIFLF